MQLDRFTIKVVFSNTTIEIRVCDNTTLYKGYISLDFVDTEECESYFALLLEKNKIHICVDDDDAECRISVDKIFGITSWTLDLLNLEDELNLLRNLLELPPPDKYKTWSATITIREEKKEVETSTHTVQYTIDAICPDGNLYTLIDNGLGSMTVAQSTSADMFSLKCLQLELIDVCGEGLNPEILHVCKNYFGSTLRVNGCFGKHSQKFDKPMDEISYMDGKCNRFFTFSTLEPDNSRIIKMVPYYFE